MKRVKVLIVECEVYTRVVGYYRPLKRFNKGKRKEFTERKPYTVPPGRLVLAEQPRL